MNIDTLLRTLEDNLIQIGVVDDQLRVIDEHENLNDELMALLKSHKPELIAYIKDKHQSKPLLSAEEIAELKQQYVKLEGAYPATAMQLTMLVDNQRDEKTVSYNMQQEFELHGPLDQKGLAQAWSMLVQRHDTFRSCFCELKDKTLHQVIVSEVELPLERLDYSAESPENRQHMLSNCRRALVESPFDFEQPPLMRLTLVRCESTLHHFIWTYHHSVLDGWSAAIVLAELMEIYAALVSGRSVFELKPVMPFSGYLTWLAQQDKKQGERFWRDYLDVAKEKTALSLDKSDALEDKAGHESSHRFFDTDLLDSLNHFCRDHRYTLNAVMQFIWAVLLTRYSGQTGVTFGTAIAGRPEELPDVEGTVGLFVNTVPLHIEITEQAQIAEVLDQLSQDNVSRQEHGYVSLPDIQKLSGIPLFDSLIIFQNVPSIDQSEKEEKATEQDLKVVPLMGQSAQLTFPVTLEFKSGRELSLKIDFRTDKFSPGAIDRLSGHFEQLCRSLLEQSGESLVSELDWMTPEEHQRVTETFNDIQVQPEIDQYFHQMFEQQAVKKPNNVALSYRGEKYSYGRLNTETNQLARLLIQRGVKPGDRVLIGMDRCPEQVLALLAILKAGACYVPVPSNLPKERVTYIFRQTEAKAYFAADTAEHDFVVDSESVIRLGAESTQTLLQAFSGESLSEVTLGLSMQDLAYIIFTSGSTGDPKGVMVHHEGLSNYIRFTTQTYFSAQAEIGVASLPLSFDASETTILGPLAAGRQVQIVDENLDTLSLTAEILVEATQPLIFKVTPSHLTVLDGLVRSRLKSGHVLKTEHTIILSGEQLTAAILRPWLELCPGSTFVNEYGPSETVVASTVYTISPGDSVGQGGISIGKGVDNTRLYVLNKEMKPVPVGVPGELYIAGSGVVKGYYKQPELTDEKFVVNHISPHCSGTMFKTGDRVRWLPDGELEYLERLDNMIKIRGYRIESGEVEVALEQFEYVAEAVVIAVEGNHSDYRLAAYVRLGQQNQQDTAQLKRDIRQHLQKKLPRYMLPDFLILVEQWPMNRSGKVDRKALPVPAEQDLNRDAYVAPSSQLEKVISAIWCEVLQLEQVGIHDNFFDLGGNSLYLMQARQKINGETAAHLSITDVFTYPTVAQLCTWIRQEDKRTEVDEEADRALEDSDQSLPIQDNDVAIVAMSGRFPHGNDLDTFWHNIKNGVEALDVFDDEALCQGVDADVYKENNYVKSSALLRGLDCFDAQFFWLHTQRS